MEIALRPELIPEQSARSAVSRHSKGLNESILGAVLYELGWMGGSGGAWRLHVEFRIVDCGDAEVQSVCINESSISASGDIEQGLYERGLHDEARVYRLARAMARGGYAREKDK